MQIDWNVVATIAAPIIALFAGIFINRRFESRPTLISYYGHVSTFQSTPPGGQPFVINTHSVVLRNVGRLPATNVRLRHLTLPDFSIWPGVAYQVDNLASGELEIVIPTLVPGEEVIISYLYFPPLIYNQINVGIKCDQGFARPIPVLLQRQYPRWVNVCVGLLMLLGMIAAVYLAYHVGRTILRLI
jgi:hypothetical protein